MSNDLVVKDNVLVEACYQMTANEQRLLLAAIAQIPKEEPVSDEVIYFVNVKDFVNLGVHEKTAYRDLQAAAKNIYNRSANIKEGKNRIQTRWVQQIFLVDKDFWESLETQSIKTNSAAYKGIGELSHDYLSVGLRFSTPLLPYISDLSSNFTQYLLQDIAGLTSAYSIRFYEFMMQFNSTGYRMIKLDDLRDMLDLGKKYPLTADLKRRVIDTAIAEINEKSPYVVRYKMIKTGRKFTHLELKSKKKQPGLTKVKDVQREPNTIDWVDGQTDNDAKKLQSWETKGLSEGQIKKIGCNMREFVDANTSKVSARERRGYPAVFEDWKPLLRDPKTVGTFNMIQELLERSL